MKKFNLGVVTVLLVGLLGSCASSKGAYRPLSDYPDAEVLGGVVVGFVSLSNKANLNEEAYGFLLTEAKKKYSSDVDVCNITWSTMGANIDARGMVIKRDIGRQTNRMLEGTLEKAANETLKNVPARSRIAIVYITAQDRSTTEYIAGELEYIWVNAGYVIIDRSQLDRIRREQNFQMSGEVDDNTAVSIGKIIGANIIVTGRVDGEGNLRRLRLRALDTQTAQVVGAASERL
jgi:hypothetical protein